MRPAHARGGYPERTDGQPGTRWVPVLHGRDGTECPAPMTLSPCPYDPMGRNRVSGTYDPITLPL